MDERTVGRWIAAAHEREPRRHFLSFEGERFDIGDLEEADHQTLHQPRVVSDEPCLCVAALDGQIQLDGWLGKLFQPFVRL
jgi:predicted ChrR family anti-sigma factor